MDEMNKLPEEEIKEQTNEKYATANTKKFSPIIIAAIIAGVIVIAVSLILIFGGNDNNDQDTDDNSENDQSNSQNEINDENTGNQSHTHNFGKWELVKKPTCTEDGVEERTCACGQIETKSVSSSGHYAVTDYGTSPTCTSTGLTKGQHCSECNEVLEKQKELPIIDCVAGKQIVDLEPTASDNGSYHADCKMCGELLETGILYATGSRGISYVLNEDKKSYSVAGIGACTDKDVIIPEFYNKMPVTCIADKAFKDCASITSITIPASVTRIGMNAFTGCTSLKYNEYDNAMYLGNKNNPYHAVIKAKSTDIISCKIHKDAKTIGAYSFYQCTSLQTIELSNSIKEIGAYAFCACIKITHIIIPDSVTKIEPMAFSNCKALTSIKLPNSITTISYCMFDYCESLKSITIPDTVTCIEDHAFQGCNSLTDIVLPKNLKTIGGSAFLGCKKLKSINSPAAVKSIGGRAFGACDSLVSATFETTYGWIVYVYYDHTENVSATSLSSPSKAAFLLTSTNYVDYDWVRNY